MTTSHFTPRQVLEAGRRAEADGQRDYAMQFYQHVLAHHAGTTEAAEADDALTRLTGAEPEAYNQNPYPLVARAMDPAHSNGNAPGGALPQSQSFQNGAIRHGLTLPTGTPRTSGRPHDKRASHLPSNGNRKDQRRHVHEDVDADVQPLRSKRVKVRRYRLGRLMGRLIAFTGLLLVLAGLGSLGVGLAFLWLKVGPADIAALLSFNPLVAAGMAILGCVLILLSQIAKAVFDAARDRVSEPHA